MSKSRKLALWKPHLNIERFRVLFQVLPQGLRYRIVAFVVFLFNDFHHFLLLSFIIKLSLTKFFPLLKFCFTNFGLPTYLFSQIQVENTTYDSFTHIVKRRIRCLVSSSDKLRRRRALNNSSLFWSVQKLQTFIVFFYKYLVRISCA